MKNVLVVTNRSDLNVARLVGQFKESLGGTAPAFEAAVLESLAEVPSWFAKHASPSLVFIDWGEKARKNVDTKHLEQALTGMRALDAQLSILLLTEALPESQDTMHWLDRGATGLLARSFTPGQITDALAEMLAKKLAIERPRHPRVSATHKVVLHAASLVQGVVAETLNIGTGGLFVRNLPEGAKVGDRVDFELHLDGRSSGGLANFAEVPAAVRKINEETNASLMGAGGSQVLRGSGYIAWIRRMATKDLHEGFGLQFAELAPDAQAVLDRFVGAHRVRAFIPIS